MSPAMTKDDISQHFGLIGVIKVDRKTGKPKIWMYKDKITGKSKGKATVTYEDSNAAKSAISWFDGKDMKGSIIKVQMAQHKNNYAGRCGHGSVGESCGRRGGGGSMDRGHRDVGDIIFQEDTIFVSGMSPSMTEDDISQHFGLIGVIRVDRKTGKPKIWLYKDKITGKSKGKAMVTYGDSNAAKQAVNRFDGKDMKGSIIKVQMAQHKNNYAGRRGRRSVRESCGRIGGGGSMDHGGPRGCGGHDIGPRGGAARGGGGHRDVGDIIFQEDTIFVSGMSPAMTEEDISQHLGLIGVIKVDRKTGKPKIWLYKDKITGKSKGKAMVTYGDSNAAKSAISRFDGKDMKGSIIKVQMAQHKINYAGRRGHGSVGESCGRRGGGGRMDHGGPRGCGGHDGGPRGGAARGGGGFGRQGDWRCTNPDCENTNLWETECNRYNQARLEDVGGGEPPGEMQSSGHGGPRDGGSGRSGMVQRGDDRGLRVICDGDGDGGGNGGDYHGGDYGGSHGGSMDHRGHGRSDPMQGGGTNIMSTDQDTAIMIPGSNGSAPEDWREIASMLQKTVCENLGASDWDSYGNIDLGFMPKKVGFAVFGPPLKDNDYRYNDTEIKVIRQICRTIVEEDDHRLIERNSEIWMAIIFVCLALERDGLTDLVMEPVFRVPKYSTENKDAIIFIDRNCRVYKNWEDYLQYNTLPSCSYCYPKNGIYYRNLNNEVEIEFGDTPACRFTSELLGSPDQLVPHTIRLSMGLSAVGLAVPVNGPTVVASVLTSVLMPNSITCLDITELILSVLFFGHSVLNAKAALKATDNHSVVMQEHNITSIKKVTHNFTCNVRRAATDNKTIRFLYYLNDISLSFINTDILFCPKEEYYKSPISNNSANNESVCQFKDFILNSTKNFLSSLKSSICSIGRCIWKSLQSDKINIPLLLQLGEEICCQLGYSPGVSICKVSKIVYMFIKNVANNWYKLYQEQLDVKEKLMGENICQSSFDKKYKMSGKNLADIFTDVLHAIGLSGEIFQILRGACHTFFKEAADVEPVRAGLPKEAADTEPVRAVLPTIMKKVVPWPLRDSDLQGQISKTQALQIARDLTKENLNLNNCVVAYAESEVLVLIEDDSVNLNVVKLKCSVDVQIIIATVIC